MGFIERLQNRELIRKIIRKNKLTINNSQNQTLSQIFCNILSIGQYTPPIGQTSHRIKLEIDYIPTEEELNEMISNWDDSHESFGWDNIGFKLQNESKIRWLSHSIARFKEDTNINRDSSGFFNQSDLPGELSRLHPFLLAKVLN